MQTLSDSSVFYFALLNFAVERSSDQLYSMLADACRQQVQLTIATNETVTSLSIQSVDS